MNNITRRLHIHGVSSWLTFNECLKFFFELKNDKRTTNVSLLHCVIIYKPYQITLVKSPVVTCGIRYILNYFREHLHVRYM
jgi:hypothetical protein